MKKIICVTLCVILLLSLAGCEEVISENNIMVSGDLNCDVFVLCESGGEWLSINNSPEFGTNCLWEPGFVIVRVLQITNAGSLAFKWKIGSANVGGFGEIGDVIDVYVRKGNPLFPTSAQEVESWTFLGNLNDILEFGSGILEAEEDEYLAVALKMRMDADPSYMGMGLGSTVGFSVQTTQCAIEEDSFDNAYDE